MSDWIDGVEWTNLSSNDIVDLLDTHGSGELEIRKVLDKLSVEGNKSGTTVLYSGLGNDTKAFISEKRAAGYRIIDDTQAGKLISDDKFKDYLTRKLQGQNIN